MPPLCEDLAPFGVVLIPTSDPQYPALFDGILATLHSTPKGAPPLADGIFETVTALNPPPSAILFNRASVPIASLAYIWHMHDPEFGRIVPHSFNPGTNASVLLPFQLHESTKAFHNYWHTIFPGSKRLFTYSHILGNNTDIRPPLESELHHGGFCGFGRGEREKLTPVKLTLDGVFFTNGAFAGPNRLRSWEHTGFSAEARLTCAALAAQVLDKTLTVTGFFAQLLALTGQSEIGRFPPPPPPPGLSAGPPEPEPIRRHEWQIVGREIFRLRNHLNPDQTIQQVAAWVHAPVPKFHKLA